MINTFFDTGNREEIGPNNILNTVYIHVCVFTYMTHFIFTHDLWGKKVEYAWIALRLQSQLINQILGKWAKYDEV